jgi:hypothetical protein
MAFHENAAVVAFANRQAGVTIFMRRAAGRSVAAMPAAV